MIDSDGTPMDRSPLTIAIHSFLGVSLCYTEDVGTLSQEPSATNRGVANTTP